MRMHGRRLSAGLVVALLVGLPACGLVHRAALAHRSAAPGPTRPRSSQQAQKPRKARPATPAAGPNVVICVLDAARADHFGCYGYPRETTPNIDRLAHESVVFEQHFTTFAHTKPSTASLMTGLYPDTHLAYERRQMDDSLFTLARGLGDAGLRTAFFASNVVASAQGVDKDFGWRVTAQVLVHRQRSAGQPGQGSWRAPGQLLHAFGEWLLAHRGDRFFVYLHFLPPHIPYDAPKEMKALFAGKKPPSAWQGDYPFARLERWQPRQDPPPLEEWVNLYDANLRWADWAVGEVERLLREQGLLENTLLIITADHGEAFGEHGYKYHSRAVYEEAVHVPLLMRLPNREHRGRRVSALTQNIDILPTVFDSLHIPYPHESVQGRSLLPLLSPAASVGAGFVNPALAPQASRSLRPASSVHEYVFATCLGWPSYLVRDKRYALILYSGGRMRALYDLKADPQQRHNIIAQKPEVEARMSAAFGRFARTQTLSPLGFLDPKARQRQQPRPEPGGMAPDTRNELKALGYLE